MVVEVLDEKEKREKRKRKEKASEASTSQKIRREKEIEREEGTPLPVRHRKETFNGSDPSFLCWCLVRIRVARSAAIVRR